MNEGDIRNRFDVSGRVYIITGAAGLLGSNYTQTLSMAGAHVVATDVQAAAVQTLAQEVSAGTRTKVLGLECDVSSADSVAAMVAEVLETYGRIDGLVNNAAVNPKFDPEHAHEHSNSFEDFSLADWQQSLDVNVTGMFLCAQAVSKAMLQAGRGVIINVSSTYGLMGPDQRLYQREGEPQQFKPVTYTVSKAAAVGLTRYLAAYFAEQNIRVNTLTPGGVFAGHDDEFVRRYSAKTILGRMAQKEEMSSALLFLLSDASSYMTGANLVVDGGWTAW